jgi:2-phosphosulfolactate phosphatase
VVGERDPFTQEGYRCRLEWGWRGARQAAERGDILVVVDVLSFSTAVATAIAHGGSIYPCATQEEAVITAQTRATECAVNRRDVPAKGRFSLSPLTYSTLEPGTRVALASPNGATCSRYAGEVSHLLVGALVNARAVGRAVTHLLDTTNSDVTVLACGERWQTPSEEGELRFAVEDYLGAGAILSYLPHAKSPESQVCEGAFRHAQSTLEEIVWECSSGQELRIKGYAEDVRHSLQVNIYLSVPVLRNGRLEAL